ncbi:DUF4254 domain-containing protein [Nocardia farcinica]|uniref:DUF4254 domain-containing protein n=1 Tax=Nocardia farcinica TaxID=37329 RepID=UPI0018947C06|nr:DUF4254 domain-containing protein [Nocardia farcinica]MBF6271240.1 DUF4254 domain-containing protein [Nocardia farcinica]MCZ9330425.1 DUF4254 domain-containing protein [Nocardia farcinica]
MNARLPLPKTAAAEDGLAWPGAWPGQDDLLAAIRGHHIGRHPLVGWAAELGVVHTRLLDFPGMPLLRHRRARLITAIDNWLAPRLPRPHSIAICHPESVGTLIDRIAATQIRAWTRLMAQPADHPEVHDAWCRLAELVETYTDLVTGLDNRSIYLPDAQQ